MKLRVLACASAVLAAVAVTPASAADIPVAVIVDATGPTAGIFASVYAGFRAFADRVNAQGGVNGNKIQYSLYDAQSTLPGAQAAVRQALSGNPAAIIYTTRSANFAAVAPQLERAGMVVLTDVAPDSFLYPPKDFVYTPTATARDNGTGGINFAKQLAGGSLKGKRVGIIISETPYMHEMVAGIEKMNSGHEFELLKQEVVEMGSISASSQAGALAQGNPDYVIAGIAAGDPPVVIQALTVAGVTTPIIGVTSMSATAMFQRFKLPNYYAARDAILPGDSPDIMSAAKASNTTDKTENVFYSHGWVMASAVQHAMATCAAPCGAAEIKAAFAKLGDIDVPGNAVFGPIHFTPSQHDGLSKMQYYSWDAGKNATAPAGSAVSVK